MFSQPYLYLYVASELMAFAAKHTMAKINPANPLVVPIMGIVSSVCTIAGFVLLILCLFFAEHWWFAPIMWAIAFVACIILPPNKIETILGYAGVICAPICILLAYLDLFAVI